MSKQLISRLLLIPVVGILMIAVPTVSQAITVTSITVNVGGFLFCDTTSACSNKIWNLGGGANIGTGPGTPLILTQDAIANAPPFNFDTSDVTPFGSPL